MPIPAYIHVTNPAGQGPAGVQGPVGPQGPAGTNGTNGTSPTLTAITTDVLPSVDNTYNLGNSSYRWKSINVGPGTINITDQTLGTTAGITVNNGILQINGANQLQVGQLKFIDNTIESTTGSVNIQIGLTSSTGNITMNRSVKLASGKSLTFDDNTVQTTAAIAQVNADWNSVSGVSQILNKPTIPVIGSPTSFASTWAGTGLAFTGTPATSTYVQVGKVVQFQIAVACTNVTNFGTGAYTLTLPVAASGPSSLTGVLTIGTKLYDLVGTTTSGSTTITLYSKIADGGNTILQALNHNSAGNFATSTTFNLAGSYLAQ